MKIKTKLLDKQIQVQALYELDIEGKKIKAEFKQNGDDSDESNGWTYDLSPCYEGLTEDEIDDLDEEVLTLLDEIF
jgi:hypothetical protein